MSSTIYLSKRRVCLGKGQGSVLLFAAANDMGSTGGLLRYADGIDKLLLLFGTLGSVGDGAMTPLTIYIW